MGKRQKRVQGEDGEVGGAHMPDDQVEQQPLENAAPKTQLVGASTLQYLTEISEALKGLEEGSEERQLLLANVLDELSGQEVRVATDPVCSRLMEGLLAAAPIPHVCSFIGAAAEREALYELASRCAPRRAACPPPRSLHAACAVACCSRKHASRQPHSTLGSPRPAGFRQPHGGCLHAPRHATPLRSRWRAYCHCTAANQQPLRVARAGEGAQPAARAAGAG